MITNDMITRARLATSEAADCFQMAFTITGRNRDCTIESAIASLREAAEFLGYTLVEKDDGK